MSANVENMFHIGATPWHNWSTAIPAGSTIEQAVSQIPELAMRVAAYPTTVATGPFAGAALERKAIVRDDGKVVGEVGPDYEPVQSAEAFSMFRPWIEGGGATLECGGTLADGRKMFLLAALANGGEVEIGRGDSVRGYVLFANAHDGSMAVYAGLTATRVVCCNTLAMAIHAWGRGVAGQTAEQKEQTQHRVGRHTRGVHDKIVAAGDQITRAVASLRTAADRWRALTTIQVRPTDAMLRAYAIGVFGQPEIVAQRNAAAKSDKRNVVESPRVEALRMLLDRGRGSELPTAHGTAWGLYNAVTEYLTHVHGRGDADAAARRRLDRNAFGDGAREMQRAEALAFHAGKISTVADLAAVDPSLVPLVKSAMASAA